MTNGKLQIENYKCFLNPIYHYNIHIIPRIEQEKRELLKYLQPLLWL
jgi:hypothetical protein